MKKYKWFPGLILGSMLFVMAACGQTTYKEAVNDIMVNDTAGWEEWSYAGSVIHCFDMRGATVPFL